MKQLTVSKQTMDAHSMVDSSLLVTMPTPSSTVTGGRHVEVKRSKTANLSSTSRYQPFSIDVSSDHRNVGGTGSSSPPTTINSKRRLRQRYQAVLQSQEKEEDDDDEYSEEQDQNRTLRISLSSSSPSLHHPKLFFLYGAFWCLGLLNNASYVIMIAAAKNISEGGTALVFLANIAPALIVKGTAPYWFDVVTYQHRLLMATICMCLCFWLVASSTTVFWQLIGVSFASTQGGLGEASLLALAGKVDGITSIAHNTSSRTEERKHEVGEVRTTDDTSVLMASDPATENQDLQTSNVDDPDRTPPTQSDKGCCLTSFSSGTGAAGVFGFCWIWFFNDFIGLSLSATMWLALLSLPLSYWGTFSFVLSWQRQYEEQQGWRPQDITEENSQGGSYHDEIIDGDESVVIALNKTGENIAINAAMGSDQDLTESHDSDDSSGDLQGQNLFEVHEMTTKQRFDFVVTELWPYMTPLFVVYVAEYSLQSGTWTAIGFPSVQDRDARSRFFVFSNWMYQLGVFVSRSSGTLFTAPMSVLWLMPMLQVANVFLYWHVAATARDDYDSNGAKYNDLGFMYQSSFLYAGALYAGLLGGAVYVHGYKRICKDLPLQYREFALAATSFAECLGIVIADVLGLIIQSCLYKIHGLQNEAVLRCPV